MLKKLFTFLVISVVIGVFYTELTGKTNFRGMFSERVLGITQEQEEDEGQHYSLEKKNNNTWDPGKAAVKDADSYHKEAKEFSNKTINTINSFEEK